MKESITGEGHSVKVSRSSRQPVSTAFAMAPQENRAANAYSSIVDLQKTQGTRENSGTATVLFVKQWPLIEVAARVPFA